ncbi:MAG: glycoside hydrolase family 13 protein [Lachnospiraceae bacterium]|nr:glycoside hydrolase family 13 protein [Lachnospiraceae bacterium]
MDYSHFGPDLNKNLYLSTLKPVLNKKALFADYTSDYVYPAEPNPYGKVDLRFRTYKSNVDHVFLVCNGVKYLCEKYESEGNFDYYHYTYQLDNDPIRYYFEIVCGNQICRYDLRGCVNRAEEAYYFMIKPGFKTPDWAKGAVMYQIYVDRFFNGDRSNDVLSHEYNYIGDHTVRVEDWYKYPAAMGVREFYGGDLKGVIDKLDYLAGLGIDAIYFNPLFVSPSNHKYDIQDYDHIDPHFGRIVRDEGSVLEEHDHDNKNASRYISRVTSRENLDASNELFALLVAECHRRNIKVILDGVFNHCGSFNKWLDRERIYESAPGYEKGAYVSQDSPYRGYFKFHDENSWPYNGSYDGWWGHDTLPKLNYEGSRRLYDYILYIGRKWVSPPYNADGWRLDVAADLGHSPEFNHQFWKDFRRAVKQANPNAIILAEHYGDPSSWLKGDEWDSVMNYDAFMEPVTWFLTGMQKHSDDFRGDMLGNADAFFDMMKYNSARMSGPSQAVAMNELSNHDHSRFLTRTNRVVGRVADKGPEAANRGINKAVMREAVLIQMTWPGAPTIYYGDEAGLCGFTDPDNRRTFPWGREDWEMVDFHRAMIRIRRENPALKNGSVRRIHKDYNVIAYGRFTRKERFIIIVNNNDHDKDVEMKISYELGCPRDVRLRTLMYTDCDGFSTDSWEYVTDGAKLHVHMGRTSAMLLKVVEGS